MKDFVALALLSQLVDWIATCARLVDVAELELIFIYYCNNSAKVQTSLQFIYNIEPAIMLTIQSRKEKNILNRFSTIAFSKCRLYSASPDHTPVFLIVKSCQVDVYVYGVAFVLLHSESSVPHVVINEVHMESGDRCGRRTSSNSAQMFCLQSPTSVRVS